MDALHSLYPSYLFSLIMGFTPFRIQRKGPFVKIKHVKVYNVISAMFYSTFISLLICVGYSNLSAYKFQSPMQRFISFLYISLVVGLLAVNVIFNKIRTRSMIVLWKKILHTDSVIKSRGIKLNYKKIKNRILMFCVSAILVHLSYIMFIVCIQKYKNILFSFSVYISLGVTISGFVCTSTTFYGFFSIIGHMFEEVLEHLEDKLLKRVDSGLESKLRSLLETASLHQELCEIARLANAVTSVQMLSSFAVSFALVTLQIYSITTAFNNNTVNYNFVISSVLSVVILLVEKLSLGRTSRRCMQVIPKTKELLTKLMNLYINNSKITREVNAFNLQILHDQFEITAGSFFVIDLPIFLTAGSAITTYIMLFVQADPLVDLYQSMKETVGAI